MAKKRDWKKCGSCGGKGQKEHPNYEGVYISCSSCGGSGGKMRVTDDDGCAVAFLMIGASAMMAASSIAYGMFELLA